MKNAAEYLAEVKALIVMNPKIVHWTALREEVQKDAGLIRYKLTAASNQHRNFRINFGFWRKLILLVE